MSACAATWAFALILFVPYGGQTEHFALWAIVAMLLAGSVATISSAPVAPTIFGVLTGIAGSFSFALTGEWPFAIAAIAFAWVVISSSLQNARTYLSARIAEAGVAEKDEVVSLLLREFEENEADWLWQIDVNRRLRSVSPRFAFALGCDPQAAEGESFIRLIAGEDWQDGEFSQTLHELAERLKKRESFSNLLVYPDSRTLLTDSKLDQYYLFKLLDIPSPNTRVFRRLEEARRAIDELSFPVVVKLETGNQSRNVALLQSRRDALMLCETLFGEGVPSLYQRGSVYKPPGPVSKWLKHRLAPAWRHLRGYNPDEIYWGDQVHHGYLYLQEFVADNPGDTRITVIGDRAYGVRRFNREGDFRASGSGRLSWDPTAIDIGLIELAFTIADRMGTRSNAMDFVYRDGKPLLIECNLSSAAWAIRDCPGHWVRNGGGNRSLSWYEGRYLAEDALFDVIAGELESQRNSGPAQAL